MDHIRIKDAGNDVAEALKRLSNVLSAELGEGLQAHRKRLDTVLAAQQMRSQENLAGLENRVLREFDLKTQALRDEVAEMLENQANVNHQAREVLKTEMQGYALSRDNELRNKLSEEMATNSKDMLAILRAEIAAVKPKE